MPHTKLRIWFHPRPCQEHINLAVRSLSEPNMPQAGERTLQASVHRESGQDAVAAREPRGRHFQFVLAWNRWVRLGFRSVQRDSS